MNSTPEPDRETARKPAVGPTRPSSWLPGVFFALAVALGLALRLPRLDNRPMHGDEAVHAAKFRDLWLHGSYHYDPNEFHGPTLYYATLPVTALAHVPDFAHLTETHLRLPIALFGAAMPLLLLLLAPGMSPRAVAAAALMLALSPAFVFYSRYYIQETLLVFATLLLLAAGHRFAQSPRWGWAALAGVGAGGMVATKETAVLTFLAMLVGLAPASRVRAVETKGATDRRASVVCGLVVAVLVAALFLSDFFSHPAGIIDYVRSYFVWGSRAGETALHDHPWHYYLGLLAYTHRARGPVWTEGCILILALAGMLATGLWPRSVAGIDQRLGRFLTGYTLTLTLIYSAFPYKTPWCLLSFHLGMVLLAGIGCEALLAAGRNRLCRGAVAALVAVGLAHLGWLGYATSFRYPTDGRNPYAYAQTVPDAVKLGQRLEEIAATAPEGLNTVIKVYSVDAYYWPLPWYLRRFQRVGYWVGLPAGDIAAPLIIASPEFDTELTRRLGETHLMVGYHGLRPHVLLQLWVDFDLWAHYIETRPES